MPPSTARPAREPFRSKFLGYLMVYTSPVIAIYIFIKIFRAVGDGKGFYLGGVSSFLLGLVLWGIGRSLAAPRAQEVMEQDSRPPVVYLRPFRADEQSIETSPRGEREGGIGDHWLGAQASHEDRISSALAAIGPFVAVGKPGEWLTHAGGAARVYLSDDNWKAVVESLVHRAAAVVLKPEATEGTLWEVNLVSRNVDLERVLLIVPNPKLRPFGFERTRALIAERFKIALPSLEECPACDAFYVDSNRRPVSISLGGEATSSLAPFVSRVRELNGPGGQIA